MKSSIPTPEQVRAALAKLGHAQLQELSARSGVPFNTLWNVRKGTTTNPGLGTVNKFFPLIGEVARARAA